MADQVDVPRGGRKGPDEEPVEETQRAQVQLAAEGDARECLCQERGGERCFDLRPRLLPAEEAADKKADGPLEQDPLVILAEGGDGTLYPAP